MGSSKNDLRVVTDIANDCEGTEFVPIASLEEISSQLSGAKSIYQPRADGMKACRLSRFDDGADSPAFANTENGDECWVYTPKQMQSILNMYMILEDGLIKVVLESITEDKQSNPALASMFEQLNYNLKTVNPPCLVAS
jgi:hypothetical protein